MGGCIVSAEVDKHTLSFLFLTERSKIEFWPCINNRQYRVVRFRISLTGGGGRGGGGDGASSKTLIGLALRLRSNDVSNRLLNSISSCSCKLNSTTSYKLNNPIGGREREREIWGFQSS